MGRGRPRQRPWPRLAGSPALSHFGIVKDLPLPHGRAPRDRDLEDRSRRKRNFGVRFDDRLKTVLAQPAANAHDRAVRWRQLVELLARGGDLSSDLARQALEQVRTEGEQVDEQLRAAAARAVARPQLPTELVAAFAADSITVAAPVLSAVSLTAEQWERVISAASAESRRFIRVLHPELPEPEEPKPAAQPRGRKAAQPPPEAAPAPAAVPSISDVLARIERLRQERQRRVAERAPARARPARPGEAEPGLFRWECGPSGEIGWVEGVPRGALVGRSLAHPGEHNGVDKKIQRAFAMRAPFREASLTVSGEGPAAGEWKLSGIPAFEPADGRFAGYRGVGVRAAGAEPEVAAQEPMDDDALRELVHELKTPLNAIIGFAEIIDGQYLGPAESGYRERAAEIVAQARLLLSAIEDLDIAAQLRSSPAAAEGSADLNALLAELEPELKERAARRGVGFDLSFSKAPSECAIERTVLERLVKRFAAAIIDAADARERLAMSADCDVGQCLLGITRPRSLRGVNDRQLFGPLLDESEILATGFSLKLARGIAQTAGGDLRVVGDRLCLVLPRRKT